MATVLVKPSAAVDVADLRMMLVRRINNTAIKSRLSIDNGWIAIDIIDPADRDALVGIMYEIGDYYIEEFRWTETTKT